ncbi:MAG: hypothetical protein LC667_02895, partial [Thioalkalivibrio sp.]|nr:hypothetical protein [Thioalkalivibrio sp.]
RRWPSRRGSTAPPSDQRPGYSGPMAAFQVSTYGRFWVSTEDNDLFFVEPHLKPEVQWLVASTYAIDKTAKPTHSALPNT